VLLSSRILGFGRVAPEKRYASHVVLAGVFTRSVRSARFLSLDPNEKPRDLYLEIRREKRSKGAKRYGLLDVAYFRSKRGR
jgi:hypothetical protein